MRLPLALALVLLAAGCSAPAEHDHATNEWTFTQRSTEDDVQPIGRADGFAQSRTLNATASMRQIGGQWHGPVNDSEFTLRFEADVDMVVGFRLSHSTYAGASGQCDWGTEVPDPKQVGVARVRVHNTTRTCELHITPNIPLLNDRGATLVWEARSAEPHAEGWSLLFESSP